jgi:uncharacterized protein (TIGR02246 family)
MRLEDKVAIQEVIAQYSYAYDAQDAEGFAALFTEDALWELFAAGATHPATRLESRAAIHAWARPATTTRHLWFPVFSLTGFSVRMHALAC